MLWKIVAKEASLGFSLAPKYSFNKRKKKKTQTQLEFLFSSNFLLYLNFDKVLHSFFLIVIVTFFSSACAYFFSLVNQIYNQRQTCISFRLCKAFQHGENTVTCELFECLPVEMLHTDEYLDWDKVSTLLKTLKKLLPEIIFNRWPYVRSILHSLINCL